VPSRKEAPYLYDKGGKLLPKIHGHHIIYKKGASKLAQEAANRAKRILEDYGIDWYKGKECLVYAPNRGHTDRNIIELAEKLKELKAAGAMRADIVKELQTVGKNFARTGSYY